MRLLSESELRKILFKEIEENRRYLEHINHQSNYSRLFTNESLSNPQINDNSQNYNCKEQGTDI